MGGGNDDKERESEERGEREKRRQASELLFVPFGPNGSRWLVFVFFSFIPTTRMLN